MIVPSWILLQSSVGRHVLVPFGTGHNYGGMFVFDGRGMALILV